MTYSLFTGPRAVPEAINPNSRVLALFPRELSWGCVLFLTESCPGSKLAETGVPRHLFFMPLPVLTTVYSPFLTLDLFKEHSAFRA